MSSLLTNTSAMVALQTLKSVNRDTADVQNQISTGKRIANARDNAALWGISATMETDISGFSAISESLSLGTATLSVGRDAAELVTSVLDQLKGKIVAAQEENVDRKKIQADVAALRDQVKVIVAGAQFNGLNLLSMDDEVEILASLNRDADGVVTADRIKFSGQDLTTGEGTMGTAVTPAAGEISENVQVGSLDAPSSEFDGTPDTGGIGADSRTTQITLTGAPVATTTITVTIKHGDESVMSFTTDPVGSTTLDDAGNAIIAAYDLLEKNENFDLSYNAGADRLDFENKSPFTDYTVEVSYGGAANTLSFGGSTGGAAANWTNQSKAEVIEFNKTALVTKGDAYQVTLDGVAYSYTARDGDKMGDIVRGLAIAVDSANNTALATQVELDGTNYRLRIDSSVAVTTVASNFGTGGEPTGGLRGLDSFDMTIEGGPQAALNSIEAMIQNAINAAAHFGSAQGRIDTQTDFISRIMDGLTSGVGALVDADMEAASARLQALQVQQQLGIQALSIANQTPQNILALFRQ
jgi:flagellin